MCVCVCVCILPIAYMPGEAEMPSFFLRSSVRSAISSKFMLHISSTSLCTLGLPTSRSCSGSLSRGSGAAAYHLQCHIPLSRIHA